MTNNNCEKGINAATLCSGLQYQSLAADTLDKINNLIMQYPPEVVRNLNDLLEGKKRWGDLHEISRYVITRKGQIGVTHGAVSQGLSRRDPAYIEAALKYFSTKNSN